MLLTSVRLNMPVPLRAVVHIRRFRSIRTSAHSNECTHTLVRERIIILRAEGQHVLCALYVLEWNMFRSHILSVPDFDQLFCLSVCADLDLLINIKYECD